VTSRVVLLVTSPRLPPGLLSAAAWDLVRSTPVFAGARTPQVDALRSAGIDVTILDRPPADGDAVWLVESAPRPAGHEVVYGSWDPPGARLLDAVTVIDRLASPGGDPWKLQQTHQSLARFLLEEAYEAVDAIDAEDYAALREELGDVLLQVVLHARLARDWDIDDVAGDLVDKMIRRNPHVFADAEVHDVDEITEQWERIKAAEKARDSVLDGIAWGQPALALAAKVLARARRAGLDVALPEGDGLGETLLRAAAAGGEEAEGALRRAVLAYAERVRAAERAR
jgi:NTP pyrophosphatase (non-canonical NTP hydrolase)